jgi:hypothetical protein
MRSDLLDLLVLVAHPDSKVTAEAPRQNAACMVQTWPQLQAKVSRILRLPFNFHWR